MYTSKYLVLNCLSFI